MSIKHESYGPNIPSFLFKIIYAIIIICILQSYTISCKETSTSTESEEIEFESTLPPPLDNLPSLEEVVLLYNKLKKKSEKYEGEKMKRPPYTFKRLIFQALLSTPKFKMPVRKIYEFILNKYPYFRRDDSEIGMNWRVTVKGVLSRRNTSKLFILLPEPPRKPKVMPAEFGRVGNGMAGPGRIGGTWTFNQIYIKKVYAEAYRIGRVWC